MNEELLKYERELYDKGIELIAGVDEVGRGPLYGPVVTAAVILPKNYHLDGLNDSKKLTPKKREKLYDIIMRDALAVSIAERSAKDIDETNILISTKNAMLDAIKGLKICPNHVLIDAVKLESLEIPQTNIIKGDAKSASIAAASIIAKVYRDRLLILEGEKYPGYGFEKHKGYGTKLHIEKIKELGVLENHRKTFEPIKSIINGSDVNENKFKRRNKTTKREDKVS